jgi:hypothetical protein
MVGNLGVKAATRRRAEARDLYAAARMARRPADARICRNEQFIRSNIYARIGILTHAFSTLRAIIVRLFLLF